jgi:hypothetical protein
MGESPQFAVVEIAGRNVTVTTFETRAGATSHALEVTKKCTDKTPDEVADALRLRDEFVDQDYRVIIAFSHRGSICS